jgi:Cu/Ag efflux protein CusF
MNQLLLSLVVVFTLVSCAADRHEKAQTQGLATETHMTSAEKLKSIETEALKKGVIIHNDEFVNVPVYGMIRSTTISVKAVGPTEPELQEAIEILKEYYALIISENTLNLIESDLSVKKEAVETALAELQRVRTSILTKSICKAEPN